MKPRNFVLTAIALLSLVILTTPGIQAQTCDGNGINFIDLDGDGFNDNAPDFDGDGIPNGLDEDYIKNAQDGTGYQRGKLGNFSAQGVVQEKVATKSFEFNQLMSLASNMFQYRIGAFGSMSGTGVCDGTGGGMAGTGVCDGTGPHGTQRGK